MTVIAKLEISVDRDWIALNAYRMVLEQIVRRYEDEPWCGNEEVAALAKHVITEFPGSFKGTGGTSL